MDTNDLSLDRGRMRIDPCIHSRFQQVQQSLAASDMLDVQRLWPNRTNKVGNDWELHAGSSDVLSPRSTAQICWSAKKAAADVPARHIRISLSRTQKQGWHLNALSTRGLCARRSKRLSASHAPPPRLARPPPRR
eukprot:5720398-Pleurochrysis_carterae.AAC.1